MIKKTILAISILVTGCDGGPPQTRNNGCWVKSELGFMSIYACGGCLGSWSECRPCSEATTPDQLYVCTGKTYTAKAK